MFEVSSRFDIDDLPGPRKTFEYLTDALKYLRDMALDKSWLDLPASDEQLDQGFSFPSYGVVFTLRKVPMCSR